MSTKVFVGLSGGVDSSVAAATLVEQGYDVTGVYMKNWAQDLPGFECPWKTDYQDAKRVAVQLGIDFKVYDFQKQYRKQVVDYMINEFRAGRTPNPDIMCNQEIKFKLFLDTTIADGADMIATGHYARTKDGQLYMASDTNKDQTYFLYRVSNEALRKTLFPIGEFKNKASVRAKAKHLGLVTANKKDSQGICFVGKVGIRQFLEHELGAQPTGNIIDQKGEKIGRHSGAIYYTIGQRHGLSVGGGLPYYVIGKDMAKNEVYVSTDLDNGNLWRGSFDITDIRWIGEFPPLAKTYLIRTRHRASLVEAVITRPKNATHSVSTLHIVLKDKIRAITPGQSAVIYDGSKVLGGGVVI